MYTELCGSCFNKLKKNKNLKVEEVKNEHYCSCSNNMDSSDDGVNIYDADCWGEGCNKRMCGTALHCVEYSKKRCPTKFMKYIEGCKTEADLIGIELKIDDRPDIVNIPDNKGRSVLEYTCRLPTSKIRYKIIQLLINKGAKIDDVDITEIKSRSVIKLMLKNGFNLTTEPFYCCKDETLKILLEYMKDINEVHEGLNLIMYHLDDQASIDIIKVLIDSGINLNMISEGDRTVLYVLWSNSKTLDYFSEIMRLLFDSGRFDLDINLHGIFVYGCGLDLILFLCLFQDLPQYKHIVTRRVEIIKKILDKEKNIDVYAEKTIFSNITGANSFLYPHEIKMIIDHFVGIPHNKRKMINSLHEEYIDYYFESYFNNIAMKKVIAFLGLQSDDTFVPREIVMDICDKITI